jgi:hypothetical protein
MDAGDERQADKPIEPFYIVPKVWYNYYHPTGAGHEKSPFRSMWFVFCGKRTNDVLREVIAKNRRDDVRYISGIAGLHESRIVRAQPRKSSS